MPKLGHVCPMRSERPSFMGQAWSGSEETFDGGEEVYGDSLESLATAAATVDSVPESPLERDGVTLPTDSAATAHALLPSVLTQPAQERAGAVVGPAVAVEAARVAEASADLATAEARTDIAKTAAGLTMAGTVVGGVSDVGGYKISHLVGATTRAAPTAAPALPTSPATGHAQETSQPNLPMPEPMDIAAAPTPDTPTEKCRIDKMMIVYGAFEIGRLSSEGDVRIPVQIKEPGCKFLPLPQSLEVRATLVSEDEQPILCDDGSPMAPLQETTLHRGCGEIAFKEPQVKPQRFKIKIEAWTAEHVAGQPQYTLIPAFTDPFYIGLKKAARHRQQWQAARSYAQGEVSKGKVCQWWQESVGGTSCKDKADAIQKALGFEADLPMPAVIQKGFKQLQEEPPAVGLILQVNALYDKLFRAS